MTQEIIPAAAVTLGAQPTITGYIVETWEVTQGGDLDFEDVKDATGAQHSRVTYERRMETIDVALILTTGTGSEFVNGTACTVAGYTAYYCKGFKFFNSKGPKKLTGTLEKITFS